VEAPKPNAVLKGTAAPISFIATAGEDEQIDPGSELLRVVAYLNGKKFVDNMGDLGFDEEVLTTVDTTALPDGLAYLILAAEDTEGFKRTQMVRLTIKNH
jgi:hypothetical protein